MATSNVKLLGSWASPFSNRVQIALNLKSIEYEFIQERFLPKSELLLKSNPVQKKIPVFFHADKPICESVIILQYIDEVWNNGTSIFPSDPYDCAIARFWAAYIDDKWVASLRELTILAEGEEAKAAAVKRMAEATAVLEAALADCSKGKAYFGGDRIGYLDIVLGCFLGWMGVGEIVGNVKFLDDIKTPRLMRWAERFSTNDSVKCVISEPDKLIETREMLQSLAKT